MNRDLDFFNLKVLASEIFYTVGQKHQWVRLSKKLEVENLVDCAFIIIFTNLQ